MVGDHVDIGMNLTSGPDFPPAYDPTQLQYTPWGTLRFTVSDADHAQVDWDSTGEGYGAGSLSLQRLTQLDGHACSAP